MKMATFNPATTLLGRGITRLEASAGTGKTFALAGLFLRLLVEEKIPADKILVVTFTEAATAELRDRIRKRLLEALRMFEGAAPSDPFLMALRDKPETDVDSAVPLVRDALEMFDLVSIHTIHGFCQRTLQDSAFESGILFDVELVADQEGLIREVAADYFRRQIHQTDPLLTSVAVEKGVTPEVLSRMLRKFLTFPDLQLETGELCVGVEEAERAVAEGFAACVAAWKDLDARREAISAFFQLRPVWTRGVHAKPERVLAEMEALSACLEPDTMCTLMWDAIAFFAQSAVEEDIRKGKSMPEAPPGLLELFRSCEVLRGATVDYALAHRLAFLRAAQSEISQRKQQAKQQSFDDLITRLADALDGQSGEALARSVREKYRVAMIDEFQDTDPLQSKIFTRIFGEGTGRRLVLIGDPKQAIYGFRGADVHAYLKAAESGEPYSLDTNWRSETALVRAINTVFENAGRSTAFVESGILFDPVKSGGTADREALTIDGAREAPLQVWSWAPGNGVSAGWALEQLPVSVAAEISRLLRSDSRLGSTRVLRPRDVAVLVESHRQATRMQEALHALGIPGVEQAMESVLESQEAREVQWLLEAILKPGSEHRVKAALTTDLLGWSGNRLHALVVREEAWQQRLQCFAGYLETWRTVGFYPMFISLLREEGVIENLLRFSDGERRITNLLHLSELLATAGAERHLSPGAVVQWLATERLSGRKASESFQLRLESDEDAVQIVTIHRSKGLEYPVVFCPFVLKDSTLKPLKDGKGRFALKEVVLFHHPETGALTWDLGHTPRESHRELASLEQLAENVRLLYVALTRACHRCYLVNAAYQTTSKKTRTTALDWLLRSSVNAGPDATGLLEPLEYEPEEWKPMQDALFSARGSEGTEPIAVNELDLTPGTPWKPVGKGDSTLTHRVCGRAIPPGWNLSSFSQLCTTASGAHAPEEELPDRDQDAGVPEIAEAEVAAEGIFALPKGARTGDCLHQVLEDFDFTRPVDGLVEDRVRRELSMYGIPEHAPAVAAMLDRLRRAPLDTGCPEFRLENVATDRQLTEMEFHFPVCSVDGPGLVRLIRSAHAPDEGMAGPGAAGFLKGFIDLVFEFEERFYILDWKSNWLGNRVEDYGPEAMARAVQEHQYDLQYHLYALALHKYLRVRLTGYRWATHFGGVRYLFVRGIDPDRPELGVFHGDVTAETLARLSAALGETWEDQ
jgi:exodeoxyribonuclease V beta subunit